MTRNALDRFDEPGRTVASIGRECLRIAQLRQDLPGRLWLSWENMGQSDSKNVAKEIRVHYSEAEWTQLVRPLLAAHVARRPVEKEDHYNGESIAQIEVSIESLQGMLQSMVVPPGLIPLDAGIMELRYEQSRPPALLGIAKTKSVLAAIKSALHDYLVRTEEELDRGSPLSDVFERNRSWVNEQLAAIDSTVGNKLEDAYERLAASTGESRAHALTSSRRALKALADALLPPSADPVLGTDGKLHDLGDDKYINRLIQWTSKVLGHHENADVVISNLTALGTRLDALQSLASKGVHAEVSQDEAEACVMQTYWLVGDVLRIKLRAL